MSFDLWIHVLEAVMVLGIAFVVAYTKRNPRSEKERTHAVSKPSGK